MTVCTRLLQGLVGSRTYSYDELNRLTCVTRNGQAVRSYEYDAFGNRVQLTDGTEGVTGYAYNALDQLVCSWSDEGERSYRYDERGNLVSEGIVGREAEATYEYDALGRLSCARMADGSVAKYTYDGMLHRRATQRQEADGATSMTEYAYSPESSGMPRRVARTTLLLSQRSYAYESSSRGPVAS